MPDTTPTPAPKRSRALPRVWQRFIYLEPGDYFFIGRCRYIKSGLFRAVTVFLPARTIRVWPWTKVQTDVLVRDARPGGKSSPPTFIGVAVDVDSPVNDGITHYVGDDCCGGHCGCPEGPKGVMGEAGVPVSQPHSVNNITGPTS